MNKVFPLHAIVDKSNKLKFISEHGSVYFEESLQCFVVSGDPIVNQGSLVQDLMKDFVSFASNKKRAVCGYYFSKEFSIKNQLQFHKAGYSSFMNLQDFNLQGHSKRDLRRAISHGEKYGLKVKEISHAQKSKYYAAILKLEAEWLQSKKIPKIQFLLSSPKINFKGADNERWFVVHKNNKLHGFVSIMPYKKGRSFYVDHMIKAPQGNKFAMDYLLVNVFKKLKRLGVEEVSLGFNAFQGIIPQTFIELGFWALGKVNWPYNSKGVYQFKSKYTDYYLPRYVMLDPNKSMIKQMLALTLTTFPQVKIASITKSFQKEVYQLLSSRM